MSMLRWSQKAKKTTNVLMEIVALTTKLSSLTIKELNLELRQSQTYI